MGKIEYLIKTLSRTNRKDYENYCVNRIYSLLNDLDIKPMTQKYVKKEDGWYLIDLYFPQFNIGVEIDEGHHIGREEADKLRAEQIIAELEGYIEERINVVNEDIMSINSRINQIVSKIQQMKVEQVENGNFKSWEILTAEEYFEDKNSISNKDDVEFKTNVEAVNIVCGTNYKGLRNSYGRILKDREEIWNYWFPILAIEQDGEMDTQNAYGWINTVNSDWSEIYEKNKFRKESEVNYDERRIVFMKYKDPILGRITRRFIGLYRPVAQNDGITTYQRFATEMELIRN